MFNDIITVFIGDYHIVCLDLTDSELRVGIGTHIPGSLADLALVEVLPLDDYPDLLSELHTCNGWNHANVKQYALALLHSREDRVTLTPSAQEVLCV